MTKALRRGWRFFTPLGKAVIAAAIVLAILLATR